MKKAFCLLIIFGATMCLAEEYVVLRSGGLSVANHKGKLITRDVKAGQIVERVLGVNGEKHIKIKYSMYVDGYSGLLSFEGIVNSNDLIAYDNFTFKKCFDQYKKIVYLKSSVSDFKMADHDNSYYVSLFPDGTFKMDGAIGQLYLFADLIVGVLKNDSVFFGRLEKGGLDLFSLYGAGYVPSFIEKISYRIEE